MLQSKMFGMLFWDTVRIVTSYSNIGTLHSIFSASVADSLATEE